VSLELEHLRSALRRIEARYSAGRPVPRPLAPASAPSGEVIETSAGACLSFRCRYPLTHRQGKQELSLAASDSPLPLVGSGVTPGRALYLDTETTGLAGGTGTYAFLVGVGRFVGGAFEVEQFFMRDFHEEPALLELLAARCPEASGLVTYNGRGFDLPLLETRYLLARRSWPGQSLPHLDLLPVARRLWRGLVEDFRLGTLEASLLRHERADDVPGFMIPQLYFRYLRDRDLSALTQVFEHNAQDILSLAVLTGRVASLLEHREVGRPEEWAGLGRLWEGLDWERSVMCYREALAGPLPPDQALEVRQRVGRFLKRSERWEEAREVWTAWAADDEAATLEPLEELAKYLEHRAHDLPAARRVVVRALALVREEGSALPALRHRLHRLECRLAGRRWY